MSKKSKGQRRAKFRKRAKLRKNAFPWHGYVDVEDGQTFIGAFNGRSKRTEMAYLDEKLSWWDRRAVKANVESFQTRQQVRDYLWSLVCRYGGDMVNKSTAFLSDRPWNMNY